MLSEAQQVLADLLSGQVVHMPVSTRLLLAQEIAVVKAVVSVVTDESLKISIRRATHRLEELPGPSCEPLCLQLDQTHKWKPPTTQCAGGFCL